MSKSFVEYDDSSKSAPPNTQRAEVGSVPRLVQGKCPKCPALSIKAKMLVDDALSLGLTSLVKSLAEALEKV